MGKKASRFDYLKSRSGEAPRPAGREEDEDRIPAVAVRPRGETQERVETVYVRRETVHAVWREVKQDGGESVSELVEDLLLAWLRERL